MRACSRASSSTKARTASRSTRRSRCSTAMADAAEPPQANAPQPAEAARKRREEAGAKAATPDEAPVETQAVTAPEPGPEPDTGETQPMTVREALRDAMASEMRRRRPRVPAGRGGRAVSGRVQGQPGIARGVRPEARHRHADHRAWLRRPRGRRGDGRAAADRRVHDLQLRDAGDRPDHQLRRQDAVHVGRPDGLPDRVPRPERRRRPRRRAAQPMLCLAGTRMFRG